MQKGNRVLQKSKNAIGFSFRKRSDINDANCGLTPNVDDDRIVGGTETEPAEYPWNVALTLQWGLQFCGGSLINEQVSSPFLRSMYFHFIPIKL